MRPVELRRLTRTNGMSFTVLDTGVWYALCDLRDQIRSRETIDDIYERLEFHTIILPWPVAYEALRTSFVKNKLALARFEQEVKSPRIKLLDDKPYRDRAYDLVFESSLRRGRPLSMVDCLIRLLIEDVGVNIRCLVTFNERDFVDVCKRRQIELWSQ
jgi:predicted nucleic acid-binding protein